MLGLSIKRGLCLPNLMGACASPRGKKYIILNVSTSRCVMTTTHIVKPLTSIISCLSSLHAVELYSYEPSQFSRYLEAQTQSSSALTSPHTREPTELIQVTKTTVTIKCNIYKKQWIKKNTIKENSLYLLHNVFIKYQNISVALWDDR